MKYIKVVAHDRNGVEIQDGDIIKSNFGVTTVVRWIEEKRQYMARDEAPFPVDLKEEDIERSFEVIGNVEDTPDFVPIYERDVVDLRRAELHKDLPSPWEKFCNLVFN